MTDIVRRLRNRKNDNPMSAEHLMDAAADEIGRLRHELAEIITFATTRKQDGIEMGAVVWKIALEDIIKDARAALASLGE